MEYSYLDGEIIAGQRIGRFCLGWSMEELIESIGSEFEYEVLEKIHGYSIKNKNITFFLNGQNHVDQIYVSGDYRGKFLGQMGVGTIPSQMKGIEYYYVVANVMETWFVIPDYPGIIFEPSQRDMFRDDAPIEVISIGRSDFMLWAAKRYQDPEEQADSRDEMDRLNFRGKYARG